MSELSKMDPTGRFTGLADVYSKCRPDYPAQAVDAVMHHCRLGPRSVLVDVGCGTGISSQLFAQRQVTVIGIEPNDDMRQRACERTVPEGVPAPQFRSGKAEATGLADGCADAVLAAQAFHWFDPGLALKEFHRILKPDGWVALLWNERDEADSFTAAYGKIVRWSKEAERLEDLRRQAGEPLLVSPLFRNSCRLEFPHVQALDEEGLVGRALSASYAPSAPGRRAEFESSLRELVRSWQRNGNLPLRYTTSLYLGQRHDTTGAAR